MDAEINGIRLSYQDVGSGPALLLLHAFPLSGAMWRPQVEALRGRHRLIVPDLRGFGASAAPPGPYPMDLLAEDMLALLDQLGLERVGLVGLSMGGYVAMALMRRSPGRFSALVLADTRAGADTPEGRAAREANARLAEEQGSLALAERVLPGLLGPAAPDALRGQLRAMIGANSPRGIAGALRGMAERPDSAASLAAVAIPTLVIVGEQDGLTPPREASALNMAIPGSQVAVIPGAGHLSSLEAPAAFNTALLAFLQGAL